MTKHNDNTPTPYTCTHKPTRERFECALYAPEYRGEFDGALYRCSGYVEHVNGRVTFAGTCGRGHDDAVSAGVAAMRFAVAMLATGSKGAAARVHDVRATRVPRVGDGATVCLYADSHAATVTRVSASGKSVWVKRDVAKLESGSDYTGDAVYSYAPNPHAAEECFTLRKHGGYVRKGEPARDGTGLGVGHRREYRNPHF